MEGFWNRMPSPGWRKFGSFVWDLVWSCEFDSEKLDFQLTRARAALHQFGKITELTVFISETGKAAHARYIWIISVLGRRSSIAWQWQVSAELTSRLSGVNPSCGLRSEYYLCRESVKLRSNNAPCPGGAIKVLGVGWIPGGRLLRQTSAFLPLIEQYCFRQRVLSIPHCDYWNRVPLELGTSHCYYLDPSLFCALCSLKGQLEYNIQLCRIFSIPGSISTVHWLVTLFFPPLFLTMRKRIMRSYITLLQSGLDQCILFGGTKHRPGESISSLCFLSIKSLNTSWNLGKCHGLILNSVIEVRLKNAKLLRMLPRIPLKKKNWRLSPEV